MNGVNDSGEKKKQPRPHAPQMIGGRIHFFIAQENEEERKKQNEDEHENKKVPVSPKHFQWIVVFSHGAKITGLI